MTRLPEFELHRPETVERASELFAELGDDAVAYAGGTELFLLFKLGFAEYPHVIDLKGIDELRGISVNGSLRIGAAETHRAIERDDAVRTSWPRLAAMERGVGNLRVRTMGSIGGNLCFADPHSDPATFLLAAGASVEARAGGREPRTMDVGELIVGPFENVLEPGELLSAVIVPPAAPGAGMAHRKLILNERPAITLSCHLRLDGGELRDVRVAVGSAGIVAARAEAAERALDGIGRDELDSVLAGAREAAADAADPVEDANGSVEYKRHMVGVLTERCLREALDRAATLAGHPGAGEL